ncbi:MAG: hypothetical protein ACPG19_07665 [Saprospiraceae bacterium]
MINIIRTMPDDKYFHWFERLLLSLYTPQQSALKQSEGINKAYLESCLVLIENGVPKARVALYDNPHLYYKGKKAICLGNYECVNDTVVSQQILQEAIEAAKKLDAEYIIGPMNGSTWDSYRFSLHHDVPNIFLEPYHHLYYNEQFRAIGFELISQYFSSKDTNLKHDFPHVLEAEKAFRARGVVFKNVEKIDFEKELGRLYDFNLLAFQANFLYTPISKTDFINKYTPVKSIIHSDFLIIAEDERANLIGFFFCLPDFENKEEKSLVIKTIARHSGKQWRGLGHVIGNLIYRNAVKQGYQSIIHAFMMKNGYSKTISKNYSGQPYKHYGLYGMVI